MFRKENNVKIYHIAKGLYLTSNNVVIDFYNIGSFKYAKVFHKSSLPIAHFSNPVQSQRKVLEALKPLLSKYDFNLDVDIIRKEIDENIGLSIRDEISEIKKKTKRDFN